MRSSCRYESLLAVVFVLTAISQMCWADPCPNGTLPPGTGQDIVISTPCNVGGQVPTGLYQYGNVNIIAGGSLNFSDAKIDFWAKAILVENNGSLLAGTTMPIGTAGGTLTIHLYGTDQGQGGKG